MLSVSETGHMWCGENQDTGSSHELNQSRSVVRAPTLASFNHGGHAARVPGTGSRFRLADPPARIHSPDVGRSRCVAMPCGQPAFEGTVKVAPLSGGDKRVLQGCPNSLHAGS